MLDNLLAQPREVTLIYHTPLERAVLDMHEAFELVADDVPYAAIYRRRHDGARAGSKNG